MGESNGDNCLQSSLFILYLGKVRGKEERAAPSFPTASVSKSQEWLTIQCHPMVPDVEHIRRVLLKWFQQFGDAVDFIASKLRKSFQFCLLT